MRTVSKPDLGGGVSHPARFGARLLRLLAEEMRRFGVRRVLDPYAGTGRIHAAAEAAGAWALGVELEWEWARLGLRPPGTIAFGPEPGVVVGDARRLPVRPGACDAVATSPPYGNRLADSHDAKDGSLRRSYRFDLGRPLRPGNVGAAQWGSGYRSLCSEVWAETTRVVPTGRLWLNLKDHYRSGVRVPVVDWHVATLEELGWRLEWSAEVDTGSLRVGANRERRLPERVLRFARGEVPCAPGA